MVERGKATHTKFMWDVGKEQTPNGWKGPPFKNIFVLNKSHKKVLQLLDLFQEPGI